MLARELLGCSKSRQSGSVRCSRELKGSKTYEEEAAVALLREPYCLLAAGRAEELFMVKMSDWSARKG